jgi:hypothetical protein
LLGVGQMLRLFYAEVIAALAAWVVDFYFSDGDSLECFNAPACHTPEREGYFFTLLVAGVVLAAGSPATCDAVTACSAVSIAVALVTAVASSAELTFTVPAA